jgi:hypothetical protein
MDAVNIPGVRLYDLRSNYAVANISKWTHLGLTIGEKLIHLSRSMGHRKLNQTYGYFIISPVLADKLKYLYEEPFNNLLPKINYDEI